MSIVDLFGEIRLGLGCMALTGLFGHVDRSVAIRTIHHAMDIGVRHFDTAELYGPYENEEVLAEALAVKPDAAVLATKVGYRLVDGKIVGLDSRPESLRQAVEGSLRRLRRDRIDLVYQHRQDPNIPVEEAVGSLVRLQTEGKIGRIGLSAIDSATFIRATAVTPIAAVQNEYSLLQREPERDLLVTLAGSETTFVAYSPLARGLLTGTARSWGRQANDDYRRSDERFAPDRLATITTAVAALHDIAAKHNVAPTVVALSWLLSRSLDVAAIPGCKSPAQVSLVIDAAQFKLGAEEAEHLETLRL
ncbi:aldo/keto reductase [Rhizobium leguminosarum bv. viciae]|uniref:aldo/keto reductase n=1 Tax=Rhizobium leguminosarum TaxID=384 RepID=UPI0014423E0F|nr:aldo/keto reductase [Rhizobium leguminosarum]NKK87522.1 aldo/keto reductase [Rhizobium leguminosarum bv. viciae]